MSDNVVRFPSLFDPDQVERRVRETRLLALLPDVYKVVEARGTQELKVIRGVNSRLLRLKSPPFIIGFDVTDGMSSVGAFGASVIGCMGFYSGVLAQLVWYDRRADGGSQFTDVEFAIVHYGDWLEELEALVGNFRSQ